MLLNPYLFQDTNDNKFVSDESFKKAGIVYHKRKIYILKKYSQKCFGENSIFNSYVMNTVILVNISRTKIKKDVYRNIKSTYSFSFTSTTNDIISEFNNARLRLNYCITSGYDCDALYKEGEFVDSLYYDDLGFTFGYDEHDDPVEVNINDMFHCNESEDIDKKSVLKIPNPTYYTTRQYKINNGVPQGHVMLESRYYDARDLIDSNTDIYLVDEKESTELNRTVCSDSDNAIVPANNNFLESWERIKDAEEIPFDMFILNSLACFSSYKFIYDTKEGFNIKDINTDKTIIKSRNTDYIEMIAKRMKKYCDNLSKIYGNIRIHYYSCDISDKIEIIFEDKKFHKVTSTYDRNSMFERLMVFVTDKYEPVLNRGPINYDIMDDYYSLT